MTWNYRIIRNKKGYVGLHEVFYNGGSKKIKGYSEPILTSENEKELIGDLELMLKDCKKHQSLSESEIKI